ncbi:hypothetical protein WR25_19574 [Diploscapter pachys]|uniref:NAD-specific glutamate dehydrogenase n=1 Tax=Diploscapter pachys TaxID=2018661 RepID=A0A2A2LCA3_9BILA|nr:hypothetical protein WR25_19574 [Diploscapter pachys]
MLGDLLLVVLDLDGGALLVAFARFDVADTLLEVLTALLLGTADAVFAVFGLEFVFEELLVSSGHLLDAARLEGLHDDASLELIAAAGGLDDGLDLLLAEGVMFEGIPVAEDGSTGLDTHSPDVVSVVDILGELFIVGVDDGLLFGLDVVLPHLLGVADEDDGAAMSADDGLLVLRNDDGVVQFEFSLEGGLSDDFDWGLGFDGGQDLDTLLEERSPEAHFGDVGGGERRLNLEFDANSERQHLHDESALSREDGGEFARDGQRQTDGGGHLAGGLVEEGGVVHLEFVVAVEETVEVVLFDASFADVLLNDLVENLVVNGEDGEVHLLVAEVQEGVRLLGAAAVVGFTGLDRELLGQLLEEVQRLLDAAAADDGGRLLLEVVQLAGDLLEDDVEILLAETDLGKVLVPVSSEDGVEVKRELLGDVRVLSEERGEVEAGTGEEFLREEREVQEGRVVVLLGLEAGEGQEGGDVLGDGLVARRGRLGQSLEHVVGEGGNLLVRFALHL